MIRKLPGSEKKSYPTTRVSTVNSRKENIQNISPFRAENKNVGRDVYNVSISLYVSGK